MKKLFKVVGWLLVVAVTLALGAYAWAYMVATRRYSTQWTFHAAEFPIPFPLTEGEVAELAAERRAGGAPAGDPLAGLDLAQVALERARARGKHLIDSRVGCAACHGADFGGNAVIDQLIVGRWVAPNLTSGQGSGTRGFTAADWDRAVRHGVKRDGTSSSMPSSEMTTLSDRELSDIVAYLQSVPPVNRDLGQVRLGPIFTFMLATDPKALSAFSIDHERPHPVEPPLAEPTVELGRHIAQVCTGCHNEKYSGGKIQGDPNMPIVANLTPHPTGLAGWTETDFIQAMREGKRKDGTAIAEQMPWRAYSQMGDVELKAVWASLQTLPPVEQGQK